jgi:hypothetical protein
MHTVQWTIFTFLTLILILYILLELCPFKVNNMVIFHTNFKIVYIVTTELDMQDLFILSTLKGHTSSKRYNFRIKVENAQVVTI